MKEVLLLGTVVGITKEQGDRLVKQMGPHFPDKEVLIAPGVLWSQVIVVNEIVEALSAPKKKVAQAKG